MKLLPFFSLITFLLFISSCNKPAKEIIINRNEVADSSSRALIENYWNEQENYFNYQNNGKSAEFHYWPQAHALDVLLDAYSRTGDDFYLTHIHRWFEGVPVKNEGSFLNRYYDDMEWNALALLRAFRVTGDKKFLYAVEIIWKDIQTGWNENAGGGLMWRKGEPFGKNACSNGPAAILAARLFRENKNFDDLEWAKKIYQWERNVLFNEETGAVWDNVRETDDGLKFNKEWIFTYNQGTFIGAAVELFDLTRDSSYLQDAIKATDYTLKSLTRKGILNSEGGGDGGLFKGIFIRYFTQLIQHHALPPEIKRRYSDFLFYNANTLWTEGTNKEKVLFGPYWKEKPESPVDLTVYLSGAMLMEAAAELSQNGYRSATNEVDFPVWSGNPLFEGWYADPEGIIFDDEYWIYPTLSGVYGQPDKPSKLTPQQLEAQKKTINKQYLEQTYMDAFSSEDLVNWKKHPHVLDIEDVKWAAFSLWAPSIIEANNQYYLFFGANDIQSNDEYGGIGVAISDNPEGPFKDALGKPLIGKFYHGAQPIDQFVFRDDDGQHYMYYGGWGHCNVGKMNPDLLGFQTFGDGEKFKEVTPDNYVEGPFIFKRNGKYYFMWSEGGWGGPNYSVAYAISNSPLGPFKRIGKILKQDPEVATGAGHHSVIHIPDTDNYYIVYHRRPLTETDAAHRVVCIDRMYFDDEGFIQPIKITRQGVKARPME